jgi:hypothetical protein
MRNNLTITDVQFLAAIIGCYVRELQRGAQTEVLKFWQDGIQDFAKHMDEKC